MEANTAAVLRFAEIDHTQISSVGGKGANLGELATVFSGSDEAHVPDGCCVTTAAFRRAVGESPEVHALLERLSLLKVGDRDQIRELGAQLRSTIGCIPVPGDIRQELAAFLSGFGEKTAWAVRSSATLEDLPNASFAGQQDSYLNVIGTENVLAHVVRCWASLFTDRAIVYRLQNGFDHTSVHIAVVVQQMVFPQASGIAFTADPVSSSRKIVSIDAGFGLGEALVSGRVNADNYRVSGDEVIARKIAAKLLAVYAPDAGGTEERAIAPERQAVQVLTDEQILRLAQICRTVETHFGSPQDIEWCLSGDVFYLVQSRPVTTLFPIPERNRAADEKVDGPRVYVSVGHQQMMTDPIRPLGLSFYLLTTRAPMHTAGGRLFVDITQLLVSPAGRQALIDTLGKSDPLIKDALLTLIERGDFNASPAGEPVPHAAPPAKQSAAEPDPSVVGELVQRSEASVKALQETIETKSGTELFDCILGDLPELQKVLFDPQSLAIIKAGMDASAWINEHMQSWLGETHAADTLSQWVAGNVTSEMGLELLDVADAIRPYPEIVAFLQNVTDDDFQDELPKFPGGKEAAAALGAYLAKYGMRCPGEIDITRPRWSEKPAALLPLLLNNVRNCAPGESKRKFQHGLREAQQKEQELLARVRQLPDGEEKARETQRMVTRIRHFSGYREYPKYGLVKRYFVYRQALLKEAERLVQTGVLPQKEDAFYLFFEELREAVRTQKADLRSIEARKEAYKVYEKLAPPRVITSDGEIVTGAYKRDDLPAGALAGLAVSSGVVEGRARVVLDIADAQLADGDILVTAFTDPSWTPLFVSIKGLVTEVGGLMTHGAVIAREYGLPAVVGVENATKRLADGQRIRVHGTEGYIEIL